MKLIMKKQRKVNTTTKKKEKRNRKLNKYILELEAENKRLKALKCPPISDGDTCICPIEELEVENNKLREAFGLARSMILSGENMTPQAEEIFEQALKV